MRPVRERVHKARSLHTKQLPLAVPGRSDHATPALAPQALDLGIRHRDQARLEKARKIANSKAAKADLKRRQHLMERSFADAANRHGLKRSRWRGLWKQAIQDLLIATVQNLRKLLRHVSKTEPALAYNLTQLLNRLSELIQSSSMASPAAFAPLFT